MPEKKPEFVLEAVDTLIPHPANPRMHDLDRIEDSIRRHGFHGVLVVQTATRHILAGNGRYEVAAHRLGFSHLPVEWKDVDDDEALRIVLADNRPGDTATYDSAQLLADLEALTETDDGLDGTGYDVFDLAELRSELADPHLDLVDRPESEELRTMQRTWFLVAAPIHEHGRIATALAELADVEGVQVASAQD